MPISCCGTHAHGQNKVANVATASGREKWLSLSLCYELS